MPERGKIDSTAKHIIEGIIPQLVLCLVAPLSNQGEGRDGPMPIENITSTGIGAGGKIPGV